MESVVYLYLQPPGQPADPFENEAIEVWIVDEDKYTAADKTDVSTLKSDLISSNLTGAGYNLIVSPSALTNSTGHFNETYQIDISVYATGWYYVLVFYKTSWNISERFEVFYQESSLSYTELVDSNPLEDLADRKNIFQEIGIKYVSILCVLCIIYSKKKEVIA